MIHHSVPALQTAKLSFANAEHALLSLSFNTYFNTILPSISSSAKRTVSFTLFYQLSLCVSHMFQLFRLQNGLSKG